MTRSRRSSTRREFRRWPPQRLPRKAAKSPTALKLTLESLRRSRTSGSLEEILKQEHRVSLRCLAGHDLAGGIRAQVIDKDRNPQWFPATLEAVSDIEVARYFAHLGPRELRLPAAVSSTSV